MAVVVEDVDVASGNDFMGRFEVSMASLRDRQPQRAWHTLKDQAGAEAVGEVELVLRWVYDASSALPLPVAFEAPDPDPDEPPNTLKVFLLRARGLAVKDDNLLSKGVRRMSMNLLSKGEGSSDPVVTLSVGGSKQKSTCKKKSLAPVWCEEFELPAEDNATLSVVVDDVDLASSDFMGRCSVDLSELHRTTVRSWYPLCGPDGAPDPKLGKVELALRFVLICLR